MQRRPPAGVFRRRLLRLAAGYGSPKTARRPRRRRDTGKRPAGGNAHRMVRERSPSAGGDQALELAQAHGADWCHWGRMNVAEAGAAPDVSVVPVQVLRNT